MPLEETASFSPPDELKLKVADDINSVPAEDAAETQKKKTKDKDKKKNTALKVLLIFVIIAFISGSVLGFLTARGIVSFGMLFPNSSFKWTSVSEGQSAEIATDDSSEGKGNEKEESLEPSLPADEGTDASPSTEAADSSTEAASPEEGQQPLGSNAHYAKYVGDSIVVVDDQAHIWEEATITGILSNAKAMSELSGYSVIIIAANDMLEMTSQEFVSDYFDYILSSIEDEAELIADGYIFLINLADREYYLSTFGKAMDVYTDTVKDELFAEIQQFLVDGNHEAAVNKVIEKTIY